MSEALQARGKATPPTPFIPARAGMLQRKCACGGSSSFSGACQQCKEKEKPLQRYSSSRIADSLLGPLVDFSFPAPPPDSQYNSASALGHSFGQVRVHNRTPQKLQPKLSISSPTDQLEQEADRAAELITGTSLHSVELPIPSANLSPAQPLIQRSPADDNASAEASPAPAAATSEPTTQAGAAEQSSPAGLIVDDDAAQLAPAQMRKTQFLDQLQSEVCAAADAELVRVGRSAQGCPYIENWIGYYRSRPSQYVERSLRKYAPEAAAATSAQDYIPLVAQRVRRAVSVWATTGEITGVPDELAGQLPSGGLLGAAEGLLSGIGGAISGAIGSVGSAIASIFTKAKEGGPRQADDPQQIQAQLNDGQTLDGGVRSRMEAAYGHDFSRVRVHTGNRAASLSNDLNARAFTIGSDISFAAGEYKPGTMVGDALLAHELAHVVQQGGAVSSAGPMQKGGSSYDALEEDADRSAVGAVVSMWAGIKPGLADVSQHALPHLKSGMRLSRCSRSTPTPAATKTVTVNITVMNGAADNSSTDIATSNSIYTRAGCGLRVAAGSNLPLDATQTSTILGADNLLDTPVEPGVSAEQRSLLTFNQTAGRITACYVPGFTRSLRGRSLDQTVNGAPDSIFLGPSAAGLDTFTHELGHILLRDRGHRDDDPNNLMASGGVRNLGVDNITSSQCADLLSKTSYPA